MPEKNPINEKQVDDLLRSFFLDQKSGAIDEDAAEFVLEKEYGVKPNAEKERALIEKLAQPGRSGSNSFFLNTLAAVFILSTLLLFFLTGRKNTDTKQIVPASANNTSVPEITFYSENPKQVRIGEDKVTPDLQEISKKENQLSDPNPFVSPADSVQLHAVTEIKTPQKTEEQQTPALSEEAKDRFKKIKAQILQKLVKQDKNLYTHIEADKMSYRDSMIIVDAFTMRNMNVSNLEYKTFLADLLMTNRKNDYLEAKVMSANWENYQCPELASTYFTDEKYNDFPVVNVSAKGAKLFCEWLQAEVETYMKENKMKVKPLQIRLPYETEWIYAAWAGYSKVPYEKGYNTIFDPQEGFVNKAFSKRLDAIKKKVQRSDTLYELLTENFYSKSEQELKEFFGAAFRRFSPFPADTIYPQRMKVLGRSNPVSGMTYEKKSGRLWLTGVNWKSKDDHQKMQNEFRSAGSSPFAGFRFVIINPNDSEYKNPFW
jgi:hypothetical protein